MADNSVLNAGVGGDTYASDDIASLGAKVQRIKLIHGIDGTSDGDVAKTNPLPVRQNGTTTAFTNTGASVATVTVLASNAARLRAWLFNDSTSPCYIKYGAVAASNSCTKRLLPGEFHAIDGYTGIVDAIWDAVNGNMRATELTA